jgi:hypothetical protein
MGTMLTLDEVKQALREYPPKGLERAPWNDYYCLDVRDFGRLVSYLTYDEAVEICGDIFKEDAEANWGEVKTWDEDTILDHMKDSLEFAFEKAIDERGISASLMYAVMKMWLWVLEDGETLGGISYGGYGLRGLYRIRDKYFPDLEVY